MEHDDGYLTLYAHLQESNINSGNFVKQGTIIGQTGNSGNSTGPHLHFETIDGNMMYYPEYLKGKGAKVKDFIKSADNLESDKNGHKPIGIPGGIGRYDPTQKINTSNEYYVWHTVEDERVRPEHRAKNGKKFKWDESPIPGEEFGCRCWAVPVRE